MLYWGNSGKEMDPGAVEASNVPPQLATIKDNINFVKQIYLNISWRTVSVDKKLTKVGFKDFSITIQPQVLVLE